MTQLFYRASLAAPPAIDAPLPPGYRIESWRPARDGPPRGVFARTTHRLWWLFDRLGLFASRDFTALAIVRDGQPAHRLIVTPRWYRFPIMGPRDLQLGDLWTAPEERGKGLAAAAIAEAHRLFARRDAAIWYLVDAENRASVRLIERCGYTRVGAGSRGRGPLGRYRITAAG